jgi:hypothetical protein
MTDTMTSQNIDLSSWDILYSRMGDNDGDGEDNGYKKKLTEQMQCITCFQIQ